MKKIGYILSYKSPKYVRTESILNALELDTELVVFKAINSHTGALRYIETLYKLIKLRIDNNPDIYILGFRGHEIFLFVRLVTLGKLLIFDEFISIHDSLTQEKKESSIPKVFFTPIYWIERLILKFSNKVITDTPAHRERIIDKYKLSPSKVSYVYVGTDEKFFKMEEKPSKSGKFKVFFYANFAPLHGVKYILEAAKLIQTKYGEKIIFQIVGGKGKELETFNKLIKELNLNNIDHREWMNYDELIAAIGEADVCLGGPFGNTNQSQNVITGKTFQFLAMGKATIVGKPKFEHPFVDKLNCILINQANAEQIERGIEYLFENFNEMDRIGKNGRELFVREFSSKQILKSLNTILKK